MKKIVVLSILLSLALPVVAAAETHLVDRVIVEKDLEYGNAETYKLKLDLYRPEQRNADFLPAVVWVHGGGWEKGDKGSGRDRLVPFVSSGAFIGVSINYRLTDVAAWPAQIHDAKAAIRWVRANSKQYGIDPARICVWGSSAGGHIAALLGSSADNPELEGTNGSPGQSSRVQCVVDVSGPSDLLGLALTNPELFMPRKPVFKLLGGSLDERKAVAKAASPISYVKNAAPPFLIIHGTNDSTVSMQQSETLDASLKKAGVSVAILKIEGGGHKLEGPKIDGPVMKFIEKQLKF